jgi:tetratricopeptide (TPR) repeat protein
VAALLCLFVVAGSLRAQAQADEPPPTDSASPAVSPTAIAPAAEPAASEMNSEAKAHYTRGLELYAARNFAAAVPEFELGFAIDPRREFLFAEAQALRLAGACTRAVPLYRRFLESDPSPLQIEAARLGLDRCAPDRASPSSPAPSTSGQLSAPPSAPAPVPAALPIPEHPAWWHDLIAASSLGAGVVALGFGTGFAIASNRVRDQAKSARTTTYFEFSRLWETAQQRRAIAVTCFGAGAIFLAAGGARLVYLHRRERTAETARAGLSWLPAPGGGTLMWESRF